MVQGKELDLAYHQGRNGGSRVVLHVSLRFSLVTAAEDDTGYTMSKGEHSRMTSLDLCGINTSKCEWRNYSGLRELSRPFVL